MSEHSGHFTRKLMGNQTDKIKISVVIRSKYIRNTAISTYDIKYDFKENIHLNVSASDTIRFDNMILSRKEWQIQCQQIGSKLNRIRSSWD